MKKTAKIVFLLIVWSIVLQAKTNSQTESFLDLKVERFALQQVTMEQALARLHLYGIVVCLEKIPRPRGSEEKRISLDLSEVPIRNILDEIVKADPRYKWEYVDLYPGCRLVNVVPKGTEENSQDLLNTRIAVFKYTGQTLEQAISSIYDLSPELQQRLKYGGKTGSSLAGVPSTGDHGVQKVSVVIENETVRQILNKLICMSGSSKGWLFEFILDRSFPSGGYHISRTF